MAMPGWHFMVLGVGRLGYNHQGGRSGDDAFESSNWSMVHVGRSFGRGRLSLMLMNSLEPWTFEKRGSPELFQTGESYQGQPLVDRQHPHDFFMNLSDLSTSATAGPRTWFQRAVGEPVIGPTAFMHRASSGENPTAPLGHHWQDSTHITFNVVTAGFGWNAVSLEGSLFHGAEPDEDRWDIEGGSIDSAAGRLKLSLPGGWSPRSRTRSSQPEAVELGDLPRTTGRPLWARETGPSRHPFWVADGIHGVLRLVLPSGYQLTRADHCTAGRMGRKDRTPPVKKTYTAIDLPRSPGSRVDPRNLDDLVVATRPHGAGATALTAFLRLNPCMAISVSANISLLRGATARFGSTRVR